MITTFHRRIKNDLKSIVSYYQAQSGPELADALIVEFNAKVKDALDNPKRFALYKGDVRRVNLNRFPYHFLYFEIDSGIQVLVVRHNSRHPLTGLERR